MDWANEKAEALRETLAKQPDSRHAMLMAAALREAYERGRQEERWACYEAVTLAFAQFRGGSPIGIEQQVSAAIAARGPMRKPEEE